MWGRFRIAVLRRDLGNFPPRGKPPRSHPNELRQKPVEAVSWLILRASEQAQLGWNLKVPKNRGGDNLFSARGAAGNFRQLPNAISMPSPQTSRRVFAVANLRQLGWLPKCRRG